MGNTFPLKPNSAGYIRVQFYDGRSETDCQTGDKYPALIELKYFGELPELKEPRIRAELRPFLDRGAFQGYEFDDDSIDVPEVTFEVDIVDDQVSTNSYMLQKWFQELKAPDEYGSTPTDALISTNDGNAQVRAQDGSTQALNLPTGLFTVGMVVLFDNGNADTKFGFDFPYVEIRDSSFSSGDGRGKFGFTVRIWGVPTPTSELKTQSTVS